MILRHLQGDFLLGFLRLQSRHRHIRLSRAHLVLAFAPFPQGNFEQQPDTPRALKLLLKPIEQTGIGHPISSCQRQCRQEGSAVDFHLLFIDFLSQRQLFQFGTLRQSHGHSLISTESVFYHLIHLGHRLQILQLQRAVEWQTANLCQEHAREGLAIFHAEQGDVSFVQFHCHSERIGFCCHAFAHHLLHIAIETTQEVAIFHCQRALMVQTHHLPVGFVHIIHQFLLSLTHLLSGELGGIARQTVVGTDFSTHIQRLGEHHRTHCHIARVGSEFVDKVTAHRVQTCFCLFACHHSLLQQGEEVGMFGKKSLRCLHKLWRHALHQLRA